MRGSPPVKAIIWNSLTSASCSRRALPSTVSSSSPISVLGTWQ